MARFPALTPEASPAARAQDGWEGSNLASEAQAAAPASARGGGACQSQHSGTGCEPHLSFTKFSTYWAQPASAKYSFFTFNNITELSANGAAGRQRRDASVRTSPGRGAECLGVRDRAGRQRRDASLRTSPGGATSQPIQARTSAVQNLLPDPLLEARARC